MSTNNRKQEPMELVPRDHKNRFEILKMFEPFLQSQADFPVESYGKIFMCGNTILQGKVLLLLSSWNELRNQLITSLIQPLTAGINAHTFTSHEIGIGAVRVVDSTLHNLPVCYCGEI